MCLRCLSLIITTQRLEYVLRLSASLLRTKGKKGCFAFPHYAGKGLATAKRKPWNLSDLDDLGLPRLTQSLIETAGLGISKALINDSIILGVEIFSFYVCIQPIGEREQIY